MPEWQPYWFVAINIMNIRRCNLSGIIFPKLISHKEWEEVGASEPVEEDFGSPSPPPLFVGKTRLGWLQEPLAGAKGSNEEDSWPLAYGLVPAILIEPVPTWIITCIPISIVQI